MPSKLPFMQNAQYETERLILKPTDKTDATFVIELLNSPKWQQFIGDRNVASLADAEKYIETKMTPGDGAFCIAGYTLMHKDSLERLGVCGLYDRPGVEGVDLGFAFLPQHEQKGYGYEAASKVAQLAFSAFNLHRLAAITSKNNFASQKLLEKIGMANTGYLTLPGDDEEVLLYELFRKATG